jgi:crossover junction endodeoxyribonuclease RuvC
MSGPHPTSLRILGLDPGLVRTGFGAVELLPHGSELIEGGTIRPPTDAPLEERLRVLHDSLAAVLERIRPHAVVVEEVYSKYEHPRTAILMGHARGVLLLAAAEHGVPVESYQASRVKMALTGAGRASKEQVQAMVTGLLHLPEPPSPVDVSDALALALCHANVTRHEALGR